MGFDQVLAQEQAVDYLKACLTSDRLAHAYLFTGPDGVGKALTARLFAKALLCEKSKDDSCGECPACRRFDHGNHPDVREIETVVAEGRQRISNEQIDEDIQDELSLKHGEGYRVFIMHEAERMSEGAANRLLKVLEEPPAGAVLILLTARPETLLETIVSRCQAVRFRPLPQELVKTILGKQDGMSGPEAELLARLSNGSAGLALEYHEHSVFERHVELLQMLDDPQADNFRVLGALTDWSTESESSLQKRRELLCSILDPLALHYRDAIYRAEGFVDAADDDGPDSDTAHVLLTAVLEAREQLDQNANIELLLMNMINRLLAARHPQRQASR